MRSLQWTTSHAVFVTEIDDEHKEIFDAISGLQTVLASQDPASQIQTLTQRLVIRLADHFSHEERLMRAARYHAIPWHKRQHENARRQVRRFAQRIENGDVEAPPALIEYLTSWLHDHTRLADQMLGAALRNHERGLYKLTIKGGTKPADACAWVDTNGDRFYPARG
jgi:hemerythrin